MLWYGAVRRLGAGRAGLLTGIAPVAAAGSGVLLGGPAPSPSVWLGVGLVAAGLAVGLSGSRRGRDGRLRSWQRGLSGHRPGSRSSCAPSARPSPGVTSSASP
ncbi:hypothetical protein [Geodermatophilus sp. SYSU D00815]